MKVIRDAPIPQALSELKSCLGMLTYYSKFLPDRATRQFWHHCMPFHKKKKHGNGDKMKTRLYRIEKVVDNFSGTGRVQHQVTTVAALNTLRFGLGAVFSQRLGNGNERLIVFASRSLSACENLFTD